MALLLACAFIVIVIVGEARRSRHLKPLPPPADTVITYDATTGAPINAAFIRGLTNPSGLAVSGDTLYLAEASGNKIPPGRYDFGTVGKYDAKTGAPIDASFINRGLFDPRELALAGTTLFINGYGDGKVAAYNAATGVLINDTFIDHSFSAAGRAHRFSMQLDTLYSEINSPLGKLLLRGTADVLTGIYMENHRRSPADPAAGTRDDTRFADARTQLTEYFAGERTVFDLPLERTTGSEFQRRVWQALHDIPYGETITYGELARRIGQPEAVRAVGLANGSNPLSIVVPCHRVVGAGGKLTGYGGGLDRKRLLLDLESRRRPGPLFTT